MRLKEWRNRRGLTQWGLADKSGVGWASIARIETGRANPRLSTINRLAEALGLDPRDLLPDSGKRPAKGRKTRQGDKRRGRPKDGG